MARTKASTAASKPTRTLAAFGFSVNGVCTGRVTKKPVAPIPPAPTPPTPPKTPKRLNPLAAEFVPRNLPVGLPNVCFHPSNWSTSWEQLEYMLGTATRTISFDWTLYIANGHIEDILSKGPSCTQNLVRFIAGSPSLTGTCVTLTDAPIIHLAQACPKLTEVDISGAHLLSDASLVALVTNCPNLVVVRLTGSHVLHGSIKGSGLAFLRENPHLARELKVLRITDQDQDHRGPEKEIEQLSAARPGLTIEAGHSDRRLDAVTTWIAGTKHETSLTVDDFEESDPWGEYEPLC